MFPPEEYIESYRFQWHRTYFVYDQLAINQKAQPDLI